MGEYKENERFSANRMTVSRKLFNSKEHYNESIINEKNNESTNSIKYSMKNEEINSNN